MEEGNVRGDIPGSRSRDIGYEFVNFRRPDWSNQAWVEGTGQWHRRTGQAGKERGPGFVGTSIKKSESTVDCARQHTRACAA